MKTIAKIIEARGGMESLKTNGSLRIENGRLLPLVVEYAGQGPRGHDLDSVAHVTTINDDTAYDPEMEFEIDPTGKWLPVSIRQDPVDFRRVAVWVTDRRVQLAPAYVRELERFARMWDRNLRAQGFLEAVEAKSPPTKTPSE